MIKIKISSIIEAKGDSKELVKLNADRIRATKQKPEDKNQLRDFESNIKKDAEAGEPPSIFSSEIINYFEDAKEETLPKTGLKAFVKWLANIIISTKRLPKEEDVQKISSMFDWSNENQTEQEWKFNYSWTYDQALEKAETFISSNIKGLNQFKIPAKWKLNNGYSIVEISTSTGNEEDIKNDLKLESCDKNMNHCAGSLHVDKVLSGDEIIYSLRGPNNRPHVTLSYLTAYNKFVECKGKSNSVPKEEYLLIIQKWLKENFEKEKWKDLEHIKNVILTIKIKQISKNTEYKLTDQDYQELKEYMNEIHPWYTSQTLSVMKNILSISDKIYKYDKENMEIFSDNDILRKLSLGSEEVLEFTVNNFSKIKSEICRTDPIIDIDDFIKSHLSAPNDPVNKKSFEFVKKQLLISNDINKITSTFPNTILELRKNHSTKINEDKDLNFIVDINKTKMILNFVETKVKGEMNKQDHTKIYSLLYHESSDVNKLSEEELNKIINLIKLCSENRQKEYVGEKLFDLVSRITGNIEVYEKILEYSSINITTKILISGSNDEKIVKKALPKFILQLENISEDSKINVYNIVSRFTILNYFFPTHKMIYKSIYEISKIKTNNFSFKKMYEDLLTLYDKAEAGATLVEFMDVILKKDLIPKEDANRMREDYLSVYNEIDNTNYVTSSLSKFFKRTTGNPTKQTNEQKLFIYDNDKKIFKLEKLMFLLTEQINKEELKKYIKELYNYCLEHLKKIDRNPKLILKEDQENANNIFGKTGQYNPETEEIILFTTDRHAKDILRSLAHELVHHEQNCRGDTENLDLGLTATDPAYASHDEGLREMEREAFERGNMIFRDWCDLKKIELQNKKEKTIMSEEKIKPNVIKENKEQKTEQKNIPYENLFQEKERLLKDRMNNHENLVFQELLKKFTGK